MFGFGRLTAASLKQVKLSKILPALSLPLTRRVEHSSRHYLHRSFASSVKLTTSGKSGDLAVKNAINSDVRIQHVDEGLDERVLNIVWNNGSVSRFPYLFLRENCKCPECFHPSTKQRLINTVKDVGLNIKVKETQTSEDGMYLNCLWPNGHRSVYPTSWLHEKRMPEEDERRLETRNSESLVKDELILWNSESMQDKILRYEYDTIMHDDKSLFDCLYALYQYGLLVLDNAPARTGVLPEMTARIAGYIKLTHYGGIFDVQFKDDPSNLAYTTGCLDFHSDLAYMNPSPQIQCFHCIEQNTSGGGASLYVDGFNAAMQLKKLDPKAFDVLCNFNVPFVDLGTDLHGEYSMGYSDPTIRLNHNGRLETILLNYPVVTDSFGDATPDEVMKFYDAYYKFNQLLYQPENFVKAYLRPGQIVIFHNTRVLHGRTAFTPDGSTRRWLQGQYFDWDTIFSKLRVLHKNLGLETPYLHEQSNDFF